MQKENEDIDPDDSSGDEQADVAKRSQGCEDHAKGVSIFVSR
jgi:hypothetical protein